MKYLSHKLTVIALVFFTFFNCSSDDDGGNTTPQPTTMFTMSVNGQSFRPTSEPSAVLSNSERFITISASDVNTSEVMTISIGSLNATGNALAVGTYDITGTDSTAFNYFDGTNGFQSANGGQITITALDTETRKISGTFQGMTAASFSSPTVYTISNGVFTDITFIVE